MSRFPVLVARLCVALAQPHAVTYATQMRAWDRSRQRYARQQAGIAAGQ